MIRRAFLVAAATMLLLAQTTLAATATTSDSAQSTAREGWDFNLSAHDLAARCTGTLKAAQMSFASIENDTSEATLGSVFGAYDAMTIDLQAINHVWYLKSVHPDAAIRAAAEVCVENYTDFDDSHDLSRKFYERVSAIDLSGLNAVESKMVTGQLRDFRQSGVDRDKSTRERVRQLKREITEVGAAFNRTILEDTRYVATTLKGLNGLPQDFIDSHPADEDGKIQISTNSVIFITVYEIDLLR